MSQSRRMTLKQVAEHAGVSTPTISKVLNGRPDVAPETRERVLKVLREQEYLPRGATGVPMGHRTIELVFDGLNNPNNLAMLKGVLSAADADGCHVAVSTQPEGRSVKEWVNELRRVGRAGVILVTSRLSTEQQRLLEEAAMPLVLIDPINSVPEQLASVGVTNWHGGFSATHHLLGLGHRRIAMIRGYESLVDDARYHGYVAALSEHDVAIDSRLVKRADFRADYGRDRAMELLGLADPPTAFFASNDLAAFGVLQAVRSAGLTVPGDISVVGFDDTTQAAAVTPALTSYRQPFALMGETAYGILAHRVQGRTTEAQRVEIASSLVVRESTGPMRA